MSNVPAIRTRRTSLTTRDSQFNKDRELQKNFQALKDCKKDFEEMSQWLIDTLDLPQNKERSLVARTLRRVLPERFYGIAPAKFSRWIAEETNAADLEERLLRENVDNTQIALVNMKSTAEKQREQLEDFVADIKTAIHEKWDARRLQDYFNEKSDLKVYAEVQELLDEKNALLSPEAKENKRLEILNRLEGNAVGRKRVIDNLVEGCSFGLEVFHAGAFQYFDYVTIMRPLKVIYDATEGMLDMSKASCAAKEVIIRYTKLVDEAFEHIAQATAMAGRYAVASPDVISMLEASRKRITSYRAKVEEAIHKTFLLEEDNRKLLDFPPLKNAAENTDATKEAVVVKATA